MTLDKAKAKRKIGLEDMGCSAGTKVSSRPSRSPEFQNRKASGMNAAECKNRGVLGSSAGELERIRAV